jgi:hypothetical protein
MIIYEGKYDWDGKKTDSSPPISWWPGSYMIKIIDLRDSHPEIIHIKPYLCIFSTTGDDYCVKNKFQNLAVKICRQFNIDPEKVMWIETLSGGKTQDMDVATLEKVTIIGNEKLYKTVWRHIRPNEEVFIKNHGLPEH